MIRIRYAQIRSLDVSNGKGVGVSLFVQGCDINPHCYNCFNKETWDFNGGEEWTEDIKNEFFNLIDKPYITRISILGGEPLATKNLNDVLKLVDEIKVSFPQKSIWLYTGYRWEEIFNGGVYTSESHVGLIRRKIIQKCDVMIDGRYIDSQKDIKLKWKGSDNQRVIDIQESFKKGNIIIWTN